MSDLGCSRNVSNRNNNLMDNTAPEANAERPDKPPEARKPTADEITLFFRLYMPEADALGNYIASRVGPQRAEDVLHDAMLAALNGFYKLEHPERDFIKWIYGVAKKTSARFWRDNATAKRLELTLQYQAVDRERESEMSDNPERKMTKRERARMAYEALESLPEIFRTAYSLHHGEGLSYPEIAERLGVHVNTVKYRVTRAKELLSRQTQQMAVVAIMDFVHGDRLRAVPMRALRDFLATTDIPLESVPIAGLTATSAMSAAGSSGSMSVSGTTGAFSITGVLTAFGSVFFWAMSVLIGAHACGAAMIQSAPTLSARRWLIRHLLSAYCGLVVAFAIFMTPLIVNVFGSETMFLFHRVFKWFFVLGVLGYLVWLRRGYSQAVDAPGSGQAESDRSFRSLQRHVRAGLLLTTVLIALFVAGVTLAAIPDVRLAFSTQKTALGTIITGILLVTFVGVGLLHLGTFHLFRRYLASAKDAAAFEAPFQGRKVRADTGPEAVRWAPEEIGLLLCVLITLGLSIAHLTLVRTRPLFAVVELTSFTAMWIGAWCWIKWKKPYGGAIIMLLFVAQCLAVLFLREFLWE